MQNSSLPRMKKKNYITNKGSFHTDKRTWPLEKYQSVVERATYTLISGSIADLNNFFKWF